VRHITRSLIISCILLASLGTAYGATWNGTTEKWTLTQGEYQNLINCNEGPRTYNTTYITIKQDPDLNASKDLYDLWLKSNSSATFWRTRALNCENGTTLEKYIIYTTSANETYQEINSSSTGALVFPVIERETIVNRDVPKIVEVQKVNLDNTYLAATKVTLDRVIDLLQSLIVIIGLLVGVAIMIAYRARHFIRELVDIVTSEDQEEDPKHNFPSISELKKEVKQFIKEGADSMFGREDPHPEESEEKFQPPPIPSVPKKEENAPRMLYGDFSGAEEHKKEATLTGQTSVEDFLSHNMVMEV